MGVYDLCDDFLGNQLSENLWFKVRKQWGTVNYPYTNQTAFDRQNGGLIPELVDVREGHLVLGGLGDDYVGELRGINRPCTNANRCDVIETQSTERSSGARTGAGIVSRQYLGPGLYEYKAKCEQSALQGDNRTFTFWTFMYREEYEGDELYDECVASGGDTEVCIINHEIDAPETATNIDNSVSNPRPDFAHARFNTWIGEREGQYTATTHALKDAELNALNTCDGDWHVYKMEWLTSPRQATFWIDDIQVDTITTDVPFYHGRVWLAVWFAQWSGTSEGYARRDILVDWFRYTSNNNSGSEYQAESYPCAGLVGNAEFDGEHGEGLFSECDSNPDN